MTDLLVFRLFGPLASWGVGGVGEVRGSDVRPTRSALLGLFGSALGIERPQDDLHRALGDALCFAVRVDAPGAPLIDYHTIQWRRPRKEQIATRADELRVWRHELSTVQSRRHYRCDGMATVAAVVRDSTRWTLDSLQGALEAPVFPLSLGRKSCPPALPLAPMIVTAPDLLAAFASYDQAQALPPQFGRQFRRPSQLAWDEELEKWVEPGIASTSTSLFERRDDPVSRRRWRFAVRREVVAALGHDGERHQEGPHVPQSPIAG